jgi:hypothetical protein
MSCISCVYILRIEAAPQLAASLVPARQMRHKRDMAAISSIKTTAKGR